MWNGKRVGVIIPAAGLGRRMGGDRSKQFLEIAGTPVLARTLAQFQKASEVDGIVVVVSDKDRPDVRHLVNARHLTKVCAIVTGGKERQDSVWNGLKAAESLNFQIVLIHDAVRPFIDTSLISAIIAAADVHGAAIPGVLLNDTIKTANNKGFVGSTIDRATVRQIQTPQGFDFTILMNAFREAMERGEYGTDEASIVERRGIPVKLVKGNVDNIKITTPVDLELATLIAKRQDHVSP